MEYRERMENGRYEGGAGSGFKSGKLPVCTTALVCLNVGIFIAGLIAPGLGRWMEAKGCFSVVYLLYEKSGQRFSTRISSICSIICCFCIVVEILWRDVLGRCAFCFCTLELPYAAICCLRHLSFQREAFMIPSGPAERYLA